MYLKEAIKIDPVIHFSSQDFPAPEGWSMVLFIYGCDFRCKNCSNKHLQTYDHPEAVEITENALVNKVLKTGGSNKVTKLTLLGGDPFSEQNRNFVLNFCKRVYDYLDVCVYTGHEVDFVKTLNFNYFTLLKCGLFDENKYQMPEKTNEHMQFASSNQKLYDNNFNLLSNNGKYLFKEINK